MREYETIKKLKEERKKKLHRKFLIGIAAIVIIAIIISAYAFYLSIQDTYWKPEGKFSMPEVDWNTINSSYTVVRKSYNDINKWNNNKPDDREREE